MPENSSIENNAIEQHQLESPSTTDDPQPSTTPSSPITTEAQGGRLELSNSLDSSRLVDSDNHNKVEDGFDTSSSPANLLNYGTTLPTTNPPSTTTNNGFIINEQGEDDGIIPLPLIESPAAQLDPLRSIASASQSGNFTETAADELNGSEEDSQQSESNLQAPSESSPMSRVEAVPNLDHFDFTTNGDHNQAAQEQESASREKINDVTIPTISSQGEETDAETIPFLATTRDDHCINAPNDSSVEPSVVFSEISGQSLKAILNARDPTGNLEPHEVSKLDDKDETFNKHGDSLAVLREENYPTEINKRLQLPEQGKSWFFSLGESKLPGKTSDGNSVEVQALPPPALDGSNDQLANVVQLLPSTPLEVLESVQSENSTSSSTKANANSRDKQIDQDSPIVQNYDSSMKGNPLHGTEPHSANANIHEIDTSKEHMTGVLIERQDFGGVPPQSVTIEPGSPFENTTPSLEQSSLLTSMNGLSTDSSSNDTNSVSSRDSDTSQNASTTTSTTREDEKSITLPIESKIIASNEVLTSESSIPDNDSLFHDGSKAVVVSEAKSDYEAVPHIANPSLADTAIRNPENVPTSVDTESSPLIPSPSLLASLHPITNELETASPTGDQEQAQSQMDDLPPESLSKPTWVSSLFSLIGLGNNRPIDKEAIKDTQTTSNLPSQPEIVDAQESGIEITSHYQLPDEVHSISASPPEDTKNGVEDDVLPSGSESVPPRKTYSEYSLPFFALDRQAFKRKISDKVVGSNNSKLPYDDGSTEEVLLTEDDAAFIRSALQQSPFLNGLDAEQVEQFVRSARLKSYPTGSIVVLADVIHDDEDRDSTREEALPQNSLGQVSETARQEPQIEGFKFASHWTALEGRIRKDIFHSEIQGKNPPGRRHFTRSFPPQKTVIYPNFVYIIRSGSARCTCSATSSSMQLEPGRVFGERSVLFRQPHSTTVTSSGNEPLQCWVVDRRTFIDRILPASRQDQAFFEHHSRQEKPQLPQHELEPDAKSPLNEHLDDFLKSYLLLEDYVKASCETSKTWCKGHGLTWTPWMSLSLASTYKALTQSYEREPSKMFFEDFAMLQLLQRSRMRQGDDLAYLALKNDTRDYVARVDFERLLKHLHRNQSWFFLGSDSSLVQRYFGGNTNSMTPVLRLIQKDNFSELWKDLQREMVRQAFDEAVAGKPFLSQNDMYQTLAAAMAWKLSNGVLSRLENMLVSDEDVEEEFQTSPQSQSQTVGNDQATSQLAGANMLDPRHGRSFLLFDRLVGFDDLVSFHEALERLPSFCNLIQMAHQLKRRPLSLDDCVHTNESHGNILSPFQMKILFHLFDENQDGLLSLQDLIKVLGWDPTFLLELRTNGALPSSSSGHPRSWLSQAQQEVGLTFLGQFLTPFEHAAILTLASGFAALSLYPLDLLKTRMMNQQTHKFAWRLYQNSFDCYLKTIRVEGFIGLYRGLLPQLLGVGPEKMIKMAVNDLLRDAFRDEHAFAERNPQWWLEVLTGGCAGACQVLVTNPMEVVKIRLQVQGETRNVYLAQGRQVSNSAQTLTAISTRLGLPGHYRGVAACLLRDVPFSAIYFPTFAFCKDYLYSNNQGFSEGTNLILAGSLAAIPATIVTNPADVIKTRMQVLRRDDHTAYSGVRDAFLKIHQQEGLLAFYKGWTLRMLRTVPQFGLTVWSYEYLTRLSGLHGLASPPTDAPIHVQDFRSAFR